MYPSALMRDCQPPGQAETLSTSRSLSSMSCAKEAARLRAARRLSRLLYEYGGSIDRTVVVSHAASHTCTHATGWRFC